MAHDNPKRKQRGRRLVIEKDNFLGDSLGERVLNAVMIGIVIFSLVGSILAYVKFGDKIADKISALSVALAVTQGLIRSPSTYGAYAIATVVQLYAITYLIAVPLVIWIELFGYIHKLMKRLEL